MLEIGAGTGSVLEELVASGREDGRTLNVLGTEFSRECIALAAERSIPMVKGGFAEVIATGQRFDLVVLSHVFEHFIDLSDALASLRKVLSPTGIAYVEVPGVMSLHDRPVYGFDYIRYLTHAHIYQFNLTALTDVFARGGFERLVGNEQVEAVFRATDSAPSVDTSANHRDLTAYLQTLELIGPNLRQRHQALDAQVRENRRLEWRHKKEVESLNAEITKRDEAYTRVVDSMSWRVTEPLRQALRYANRIRSRD